MTVDDCLHARKVADAIRVYGVKNINHRLAGGELVCSMTDTGNDVSFITFFNQRNASILLRIKYAALKAYWLL